MDIIELYLIILGLKEIPRTGWNEVGVSTNKVESIMAHIGGTVALARLLKTKEEYKDIDMDKVDGLIVINELKKLEGNVEYSITENGDYSEDFVLSLLNRLSNKDQLVALYDEGKLGQSKEAKFAVMVAKLESDIQAKKYEQEGEFTLDNAKKDIENYPDEIKGKLGEIKKASDGWISYNQKYYDENFMKLSEDIKKL